MNEVLSDSSEGRAEAGADFGYCALQAQAKMQNAVYCERLKTIHLCPNFFDEL